tara:strand:- start:308 stop:502 length:195 start_codon:yes stop_codon:yes gene_type:complete
MLVRNKYHLVSEALGGVGIEVDGKSNIDECILQAKAAAGGPAGKPVLLNCNIGSTDFRQGSMSV